MTAFVRQYEHIFTELADPRVQEWALMKTPTTVFSIVGLYLASVYVFVPAYMKNRKAYSLKTTIYYYNIFQIVACLALIYGISTSGWTTEYTFGCQPIDYSDRPIAIRMLTFVYYTFILKAIELVETIFFLLRKKDSQVTNLHVYHHSSTCLFAWFGVKYIGGGMASFPIIINSFIHVLMYTYYWFSALGPEWQKTLAPWKPRLTMAQMIQFGILVLHSLQALEPSCKVPKRILLLYVPNVILIFYMFKNFYTTAYQKKKENK